MLGVVALTLTINDRTEQRINSAKQGNALWDYSILSLQIVSGQAE